MNARELLVETFVHMPPARALEQLGIEDAERRQGAVHSIAEIVAHLSFWQEWFCRRCEGVAEPMVASAATGWPSVTPGAWTDVRARFLAGLERAVALGDAADTPDRPLDPPIEFPQLAGYTLRDALVHVASHNAHHLGQIIVLRQLMGLWPPPSGSWTW
jgi:uncharacterized damage-inducible protein DinB